ncbi:MAG: hypothetical protein RIG66_01240 [Coleofasciculus sp. E2-BRE-01]
MSVFSKPFACVHPCGQLTLELRRHPERLARQAHLTLHATTLELQPPATHPQRQHLQPIRVQVILSLKLFGI